MANLRKGLDPGWVVARVVPSQLLHLHHRRPPNTLLIFPQFISLDTKVVDLGEHPLKQRLGSRAGDPCSLKLKDFLSLAGYLTPHAFNLRLDEFDVGHVRLSDSKETSHENRKRTRSQSPRAGKFPLA
jgi:hypothetical protein